MQCFWCVLKFCPSVLERNKFSATIIENIFTKINTEGMGGNLITDLSDHLPVFRIYKTNNTKVVTIKKENKHLTMCWTNLKM